MLAVGAVQVLILLVALARAKFLSFAIGTEGYGIVGTIDQIVLTMASIGSLGVPFVAIKILSRNHSESHQRFEDAYSGFFAALLLLGVISAAVGITLALLSTQVFGRELAQYSFLIAIAAVAVPPLMLNILVSNALAASARGRTAAVFTLIVQAVLLAATITGTLVNGLKGLYIASVVAATLMIVVTTFALRSALGSPLRRGFSRLSQEIRRERTILVYAFWSYAAASMYSLSLSAVRTSVFSHGGARAAGFLGAALSLALTVAAIVSPISNLLLTPFVNRVVPVEEKIAAANDFLMKMLTIIFLMSLPLVLFPGLSMKILFSPAFLPAASVLFGLVAWQCLSQFANVFTQLLIGLDDFAFACVALIAGNAGVVLLAPQVTAKGGISGASLLLIAGTLVSGIASAVRLGTRFKITLSGAALLRLMFVLAAIAGSRWLGTSIPETSASGFAARGAYAVITLSILFVTLSAAERAWLASVTSFQFGRAA